MPETKKHYVYSARTTEKGLALLNKTKGNDMSWDQFVNEAVAAHYNLPLDVIALPPSKFLEEQKANREAKAAEKAAKKAKADKAKAKKAADKAKAKKAAAKKTAKATKTTKVTVKPGETKRVGATRIHAAPENTGPVEVPVEVPDTNPEPEQS